MSDRNDDFDFEDDDIFGDEFRFDDEGNEIGGGDDDFDFGDEDFGAFDDEFDAFDDELSSDDEFEGGFDFGDEPPDFDDEEFGEPSEEEGGNGFFIAAAVIVILLLLGGAIGFWWVTFGPGAGPSPQQLSATAIVQANETTFASATMAAEQQQTEISATQTAISIPTDTPTPSSTPTLTPTSETDAGATQTIIAQTEDVAANQAATATARAGLFGTQTAVAQETAGTPTPDEPQATPTGDAPEISAIQQTATAIESLFNATPTPEGDTGNGVINGAATRPPGGTDGTDVTPQQPDGLPDAGLFDDVVQGGPGMLFLAVVGLLGVIFVSRRVRNRKRK